MKSCKKETFFTLTVLLTLSFFLMQNIDSSSKKTRLESHKLGIAIVPSDYYQQKIIELASIIRQKHDLSFVINLNNTIPHLSLFQGTFKNLSSVLHFVDKLHIEKLPTLDVTGISIWANKIIFLDIHKVYPLQKLHNEIFKSLFHLSDGKPADMQVFNGISQGQKNKLLATGYPFSEEEYLPHITLAHLKENLNSKMQVWQHSASLNNIFEQDIVELKFNKLIVFEVGNCGVCKKIIYEKKI